MTKRDIIRLLWSASGQLQVITQTLSLGKGQGERLHNEYQAAAKEAGLAQWKEYETSHGREYAQLEPTESGKKLVSIVSALEKLQDEIEALAETL